jgi:ABC-type uncharacterized transport system substrate-binding protein
MNRRAFISTLASGLLAAPPAAEAQDAGKVARIGVLCATRCEGAAYDALRAGLRDLGWVEGRNLVMEARAAGGQLERLPELARELVALSPALIVASGPQPSRAAKDATSVLPVVFVGVADPVRVGLVQSLARPGENVTGFATLAPGGFMAKQLELLKEAVPRASRVATLGNPKNDVYRATFPVEIPPAARTLGLQIQVLEVSEPGQLEGAIDAAVRERADALHVLGIPFSTTLPTGCPSSRPGPGFPRSISPPSWSGRAHVLWSELHRAVPPRRELRGPDTERGEAGRAASRAAHEIRARHQSQDGQGPRPHDPAVAPAAGGSGDRVIENVRSWRGSI